MATRAVITQGQRHVIFAARTEDGGYPAIEFLEDLKRGLWVTDADRIQGDPWPDERQSSDFVRFLNRMTEFASKGYIAFPTQCNSLNDGIWEFKSRKKRISFYGTDGKGSKFPHAPHSVREQCERPEGDFWEVPSFTRVIRLGYCFDKTDYQTKQRDLDESARIRNEDLEYDLSA